MVFVAVFKVKLNSILDGLFRDICKLHPLLRKWLNPRRGSQSSAVKKMLLKSGFLCLSNWNDKTNIRPLDYLGWFSYYVTATGWPRFRRMPPPNARSTWTTDYDGPEIDYQRNV